MAVFETRVQELKYNVLKNVIQFIDNNKRNPNFEEIYNLSNKIIPGPKATFRCCIYKERAIVQERIKYILNSSSSEDTNVIKVIGIACDECPVGGYTVTDQCRGCIAHKCSQACPKKCISFKDGLKATIDKSQCVNCGMCAKACPYSAIENRIRPCERACKQKAITPNTGETNEAVINDAKCIHCGACVYTCPFGAIVDISYIKEILKMLDEAKENGTKVYAVVAPSIGGNFVNFKTGQVISAIKKLGFFDVYEAALGADMVALEESGELEERGKLFSSCCPAYTLYIRKFMPELAQYISDSPSPMTMIGKFIKEKDPNSKVVFIGPCTAKKSEIKHARVKGIVDSAMTFEELQAFIDAREIDVASLEEADYKKGSSFGRGFAQCGGLSSAVKEALKEKGSTFEVKGTNVDGMENIRTTLLKIKNGSLDVNFLEGMACEGGCIGGPCNLQHNIKSKLAVSQFSKQGDSSIKGNVDNVKE